MLFKEVDFFETRRKARQVLKSYRRWERIAGRSSIDLRSPIITDMPRTPSKGNGAEDAILQRVDAEMERDEIVRALMCLSIDSRHVLYYSFCDVNRYSNAWIAQKLKYSVRTIEDYKSTAIIEFAEAYKKGRLITYF